MSILIEKSGVLSTIQDTGRNGFRRFGINPNGAMDTSAARLINILLGNDDSEAVLEMHFPAPGLKFEEAAIIALAKPTSIASPKSAPASSTNAWRKVFLSLANTAVC